MNTSNNIKESLVIKKQIEIDDMTIGVNNSICETSIIKYDDDTIAVRYFVYHSEEVVIKDRITKNVNAIWQKAKEQQ
jgi:hypothetical protein